MIENAQMALQSTLAPIFLYHSVNGRVCIRVTMPITTAITDAASGVVNADAIAAVDCTMPEKSVLNAGMPVSKAVETKAVMLPMDAANEGRYCNR